MYHSYICDTLKRPPTTTTPIWIPFRGMKGTPMLVPLATGKKKAYPYSGSANAFSTPPTPFLSMPPIGNVEKQQTSPRGHNEYPQGKRRWNIHAIAAWLSLVMAFFAVIMVSILFFNWRGGELTALRTGEPLVYSPLPPISVIGERNHNRGHVRFTLKGTPGQYSRWPDNGGIVEGLDLAKISSTRLCCRVGNRYFVCDYGQGASSDLGVECFVEQSPNENGAHLLLNVQSDHMNGADCFFHWRIADEKEAEKNTKT